MTDLIQIYDPTIEDYYGKQLNVDNRICLVEVIDPAQRKLRIQAMSVPFVLTHYYGVSEEDWGFRDSWVQFVHSLSSFTD
jgi:hypothetical protein